MLNVFTEIQIRCPVAMVSEYATDPDFLHIINMTRTAS
jgi:hypothetical protein